MIQTLLQFLLSFGFLQAVILLTVLSLYPGPRPLVSRLTASILFLTSILLLSELMDLLAWGREYSRLLDLTILLDLLLVVLVWWLTLAILGRKSHFRLQDLWHLAPRPVTHHPSRAGAPEVLQFPPG